MVDVDVNVKILATNNIMKNQEYNISDLAKEFDISTRTLRFYEEKGLLSPKRLNKNLRVFSKRDRARLKLILRGKRFGYSLDEIAEMIGLTDIDMQEADQIKKSLDYGNQRLKEIRERINELELLAEDLLSVKEMLENRLEKLKN